jgi:hypothetical protein
VCGFVWGLREEAAGVTGACCELCQIGTCGTIAKQAENNGGRESELFGTGRHFFPFSHRSSGNEVALCPQKTYDFSNPGRCGSVGGGFTARRRSDSIPPVSDQTRG